MVTNWSNKPLSTRILIVDDEPDHLDLMASLLESRCDVSTAANAEEAIDLCREQVFDLGLLDVRLPDLPGPDLLERLQAIDRQMGFVFVTAHADLQDAVRAVADLKAVGYISKPFHGKEFLQRCFCQLKTGPVDHRKQGHLAIVLDPRSLKTGPFDHRK